MDLVHYDLIVQQNHKFDKQVVQIGRVGGGGDLDKFQKNSSFFLGNRFLVVAKIYLEGTDHKKQK